jgi:hypothetical protein
MRLSRLLRAASTMSYGPPTAASSHLVASRFLRSAGAKQVLFVPWALKDWDKYFANPAAKLEYDAAGQPKDHTGRPQVRLV